MSSRHGRGLGRLHVQMSLCFIPGCLSVCDAGEAVVYEGAVTCMLGILVLREVLGG